MFNASDVMTFARHCTRDNIIMFGAEYSPTPVVVATADRNLTSSSHSSDTPRTRSPVNTYLSRHTNDDHNTNCYARTPSTAPDVELERAQYSSEKSFS